MAPDGLEIERRYLLDGSPSPDELAGLGARPRRIEQVYLRLVDDWIRRVRRIDEGGSTRYIATRKRDIDGVIGGMVREEIEEDVTASDYDRMVAAADPQRRAIRKVRHVFPWEGWTLELDVFGDPPGLVMLEVELDDPAEVPTLPPPISRRIVREVTDDPAFTNYALALIRAEDDAGRDPEPGADAD